MYMKHKHFYVVTYDVSDTRRRDKVVKIMESIGTRMNLSVFECMLTEKQYQTMVNHLEKIVVPGEDRINIYPLCTECFARIQYIPGFKLKPSPKITVI